MGPSARRAGGEGVESTVSHKGATWWTNWGISPLWTTITTTPLWENTNHREKKKQYMRRAELIGWEAAGS